MKKKFKKIILIFFILLNVGYLSAPSIASAGVFEDILSALNPFNIITGLMSSVQSIFGISEDAAKNAMEMANSSQYKFEAPKVSVSFNPATPATGKTITASAQTEYFKTPDNEMYFTWFLQTKGCPDLLDNNGHPKIIRKGSSSGLRKFTYMLSGETLPASEFPETCDLDKDDDIDINDYKIKAARIIASDGFDWQTADYANSTDDDDGYFAPWGGSKNIYKNPYFYIYNPTLGRFFYDDNFQMTYTYYGYTQEQKEAEADGSPDDFPKIEDYDQNCQDENIDSETDTGTGSCFSEYACSKLAVDPTYTPVPNDFDIALCAPGETLYDCYCDAAQVLAYSNACDTTVDTCVTNRETQYKRLQRENEKKLQMHSKRGLTPIHLFPHSDQVEDKSTDSNEHFIASTDLGNKDSGSSGHEKGDFDLKQEQFWHTNPNDPDTGNYGQPDEATVIGLGMNKLSWTYQEGDKVGVVVEGTSMIPAKSSGESIPADPAGTEGLTDEAYPTTQGQGDSSYKIVWAFSGNGCPPDKLGFPINELDDEADEEANDDGVAEKTAYEVDSDLESEGVADSEGSAILPEEMTVANTTYTTESGSALINYNYIVTDNFRGNGNHSQTIDHDINIYCLPNSFVNPISQGTSEKLNIELDYLPKNPFNSPDDTTGENSDVLSVYANVSGGGENQDYQELFYTWKVYEGKTSDAENGTWEPINKSRLLGVEQTSAVGLDKLTFALNFPEFDPQNSNPYKFLKIELRIPGKEITGTCSSTNSCQGWKEIVIPLDSNNTEKLQVFDTTVTSVSDNKLGIEKGALRCESPNKICQAAENEILAIGLSDPELFENFHWTINGASLNYTYLGDDSKADNFLPPGLVYFPVTYLTGQEFSLTLTADKKSAGNCEKVSFTKKFKVLEPNIRIYSNDPRTCAPVILGYFKNNDGSFSNDWSETKFEALQGSTVTLEALFLGPAQDFSSNNCTTPESESAACPAWSIPQAKTSTFSGEKTITFKADNELGSIYTVDVNTIYQQSPLAEAALAKYWNIFSNKLSEKSISTKIEIEVVSEINAEEAETEVMHNSKKPLASLFSGASAYFIFLFKLALAVALMIFSLGIFSSLAFNDKEK